MAGNFWGNADPKNMMEPKRKFKWVLLNSSGDGKPGPLNPSWICKSVTRPSYEMETKELWYINHKFNFPGRIKWNPVDITIVDGPNSTKSILGALEKSGYKYPTGPNNATIPITKANAILALGQNVTIAMLADTTHGLGNSEEANILESFVLKNSFITKAEFGDLDYSTDEIVEIKLTLSYDWAEIH